MQRYASLRRGAGYELGLWRCEQVDAAPHEPERAAAYEVILPTGGAFVREIRGRRHFADATRVLFSDRGAEYRVAHPLPGGDRCTVITLTSGLAEAVAAATDAFVAEGDSGLRFPSASAPLAGRIYRGHRRLARDIERGATDVLEMDGRVYRLLDALLRSAVPPRPPPAGPRSQRRHRLAVERAVEAIHAGYRARLTLDGIARAAGYSAFHFARVFREHSGMTVHGYVNRLRLRSALEAVLDRAADLTTVALEHGFSSHSHFTHAFRQEYGTTPSAARAAAS